MTGPATVPATTEIAPSSPRAAPDERADPRRVALHRATRAAIINPSVFALTLLVVRDVQIATFAVFGCFGLLVMADFGGRRPARAVAYASPTVLALRSLLIGTAASFNAAVAATVMLVSLSAVIRRVFGGYVTAAQTALLLAFVLAVRCPQTFRQSRHDLRDGRWPASCQRSQACSCGRGSNALRCASAPPTRSSRPRTLSQPCARARRRTSSTGFAMLRARAIQAIRSEYARSAMRPAGPTRHDRAFVQLVTELEQIVDSPSAVPCAASVSIVRASMRGMR